MCPDFKIIKFGVNFRHDERFYVNRPNGSGDYVFIRFCTPVRIVSAEGETLEQEGACIFYEPPHPQWYCCVDGCLVNDWFHAIGTNIRKTLEYFSLPINKVFFPKDTEFVPGLIARLGREQVEHRDYIKEAQWAAFLDLCLRLSRGIKEAENPVSPGQRDMLEAFRLLRKEVMLNFRHRWTVEEMAASVHLSKSRFSVLYTRFFGISPLADVLKCRLDHARWMLTNTALSVSAVARESGFDNVYHFSRIFRRHVGCAPSKYYERL